MAKDFNFLPKVAKFRQLWSHYLWHTCYMQKFVWLLFISLQKDFKSHPKEVQEPMSWTNFSVDWMLQVVWPVKSRQLSLKVALKRIH